MKDLKKRLDQLEKAEGGVVFMWVPSGTPDADRLEQEFRRERDLPTQTEVVRIGFQERTGLRGTVGLRTLGQTGRRGIGRPVRG